MERSGTRLGRGPWPARRRAGGAVRARGCRRAAFAGADPDDFERGIHAGAETQRPEPLRGAARRVDRDGQQEARREPAGVLESSCGMAAALLAMNEVYG